MEVDLILSEHEVHPHSVIFFIFCCVVKSISDMGAYSTIFELGADHVQGLDVHEIPWILLVFASAANSTAAM